jgi:ribonucleotide monophosphatase NagD (HAD superfamily)
MIKGVLLDLSGSVYDGDNVLPRALEAVQKLHRASIPLRYLTKSSRSSRKEILNKLHKMGFAIRAEESFTAPLAVQGYLREHKLPPSLQLSKTIKSIFIHRNDYSDLAIKNI